MTGDKQQVASYRRIKAPGGALDKGVQAGGRLQACKSRPAKVFLIEMFSTLDVQNPLNSADGTPDLLQM